MARHITVIHLKVQRSIFLIVRKSHTLDLAATSLEENQSGDATPGSQGSGNG